MKEKTGQKEEKPVVVSDERDLDIEQKLTSLYALQCVDSAIDKIRTLRGELPLEVQDLEDDIAGYNSKAEKIEAVGGRAARRLFRREKILLPRLITFRLHRLQLEDHASAGTLPIEIACIDHQGIVLHRDLQQFGISLRMHPHPPAVFQKDSIFPRTNLDGFPVRRKSHV